MTRDVLRIEVEPRLRGADQLLAYAARGQLDPLLARDGAELLRARAAEFIAEAVGQ